MKHKPALFPEAAEAQRCSSLARGGEYSQAGVTCHFCRQKKLCGEPDCERCVAARFVHLVAPNLSASGASS